MTTVLNGSTVIYNKSGMTVDDLIAQGDVNGSTSNIVRKSSITAVYVGITPTDYACVLPSIFDCDIGDIVEVYPNVLVSGGHGLVVFYDNTFNINQLTPVNVGMTFRKVSNVNWGMIGV
jgi:hypothetical protein